MIELKDIRDCCGCEACAQICPVGCIEMVEDREGFFYPKIERQSCIECGRCEPLCPALNRAEPRKPISVYAAKSPDEALRAESSSGGIFTPLAMATLARGGVAFGAIYDDKWQVYHSEATTAVQLGAMRGSKYTQSRVGSVYSQVRSYLRAGRDVLFSGTPCQIAALRGYLGGDSEGLLLVEVACHGVPSPRVWREYLAAVSGGAAVESVLFKDKSKSWLRYNITITFEDGRFSERASKNLFMRSFIKELIVRPSCYHCPARSFSSGADITLADYWGVERVHPEFHDDRGASAVFVSSQRGEAAIRELGLEIIPTKFSDAVALNSSIVRSARPHARRARFFRELDGGVLKAMERCLKPTLLKRFTRFLSRTFLDS
ncbi:MAG: Coenzyme F420 hydrogenase/dehydrogenase, beta subunit C-terminal domain [Rikenellaceae bacterium]